MKGIIIIAIILLVVVACQGETVIVEVPVDTPTPQPTYTPLPTLEPLATHTPYPTSTAYPTHTPLPTYTPYPTYTLYPTATPTLKPTVTPAPTATRRPTNTPKPTPTPESQWTETGSWYRDSSFEDALTDYLRQEGFNEVVTVASLDADPQGWSADILLSLGCIGDIKVFYISPYDSIIPDDVDAYTVGIWDDSTGEWVSPTHDYFNPIFTDDGSSIYIFNQTQARQVLDVIKKSDEQRNRSNRALNVIMYDSTDDQGTLLGSAFDPTGWRDVIAYLPCY